MNIELSPEHVEFLTAQAAANGFDRVEEYAGDLLASYAQLSASPARIEQSAARLRSSHEQMEAGDSRDAATAIRGIAERRGLKLDR